MKSCRRNGINIATGVYDSTKLVLSQSGSGHVLNINRNIILSPNELSCSYAVNDERGSPEGLLIQRSMIPFQLLSQLIF